MSINYNDALSSYEWKGKVGMDEEEDSESVIEEKTRELATLIQQCKCLVIVVGAGVSTAAGIADFRGPNGVWTQEKSGGKAESVDFLQAHPTFSHMAITALERAGLVKWLISQNVDGLWCRSGFPMDRLAELHGNVFCEMCNKCRRKYYRDFAIPTVGGKETGRSCEGNKQRRPCRGKLVDVTLDWESELPEPEYSLSCKFSAEADLLLCLGTSLQIVPVGNFPLSTKKRGGKFVTVNLQKTKHEKKADIAIHGKVDEVMKRVMQHLNIFINDIKEVPIIEPCLKSNHPLHEFKKLNSKRPQKTNENGVEQKRAKEEPSITLDELGDVI